MQMMELKLLVLVALCTAGVMRSEGQDFLERWTTRITYMLVHTPTCAKECRGYTPFLHAKSLQPFSTQCMTSQPSQKSWMPCLLQTNVSITKQTSPTEVPEKVASCHGKMPWTADAKITGGKYNISPPEVMSLPVECESVSSPSTHVCSLQLEGDITVFPSTCFADITINPCTDGSASFTRDAVLMPPDMNNPAPFTCKCMLVSNEQQTLEIGVLNLQSEGPRNIVNIVRIWDMDTNAFWEEQIQLHPSTFQLNHSRAVMIWFEKEGKEDARQIVKLRGERAFTLNCGRNVKNVPVRQREGEGESSAGVGMTIFLLIILIAVTIFVFYWQRQDPLPRGYSEDFVRPTSMVSLITRPQPEPTVLYQNTASLEGTFELEGSMPDLTIDRRRSQMSRISRTYSSPLLT